MADNSLVTKAQLRRTVETTAEKLNAAYTLAETQSDWSQNDETAADYIKNKPAIPTTAEDVGALPIEGGTLTGKSLYLYNGQARVLGDTNRIQFETYNTAGDTNNRRVLHIRNSTHSETDIADALALYDMVDGAQTVYKLYGEHNPPPAGVPAVSATSTDGVAYTGTLDGVTELTAGLTFSFIPAMTSTSTAPTLDLNGLGAKTIKRRLSGLSSTTTSGASNNWLYANKPQLFMYDGTYWIVVNQDKPMASDLYGDVGGLTAATATLSTSGWTLGSDERYYQTVSVEGVTTDATQVIVVDPALTGTDLDADAAVLEAWQNPSAHNVKQGSGTLTFYSYEVPAVNIPINVGVA